MRDGFALGQIVLAVDGVHEIKPAFRVGADGEKTCAANPSGPDTAADWAAGWAAALGFFAALAARRIASVTAAEQGGEILWCFSRARRSEHGALYAHGLRRFGLAPSQVMIAEGGNTGETLWALEEGIRSGAPLLVGGIVDDLALTPARRLALAAQKHGVPCLILTDPGSPPAAATATRWRVGTALSGPHPLEGGVRGGRALKLPGARRFAVALERYRRELAWAQRRVHCLEWCHEAFCFDLVGDIPDRQITARESGGSGGG